MKVSQFTKETLAYRRQKRDLLNQGYIHLQDPYWPIDFGKKIEKVKISTDGLSLYIKIR